MGSGGLLRVEVLGPVRLFERGGPDITPDGLLQRRLLAFLILRRGRVVSVDSAIGALWPTTLPRDPVGALQNHLFRLRRGLPAALIESVADGYRLDPSGIDVDADRLMVVLSTGAAPGARAELDALLERWQGPAYPELADVEDGRAEAVRLGELRVRAREILAEHRLNRGETDGLVAELAALADEEPLRERPRALLMDALAATGRQAEALRVYDDFRRRLGAELGIEPSPVLTAQHAGLLSGATGAVHGGWGASGRLPMPPTSLVGRGPLVAEVIALTEAHRLVTLVGPGGVGKTRLLLEAGHRLRMARPDRSVVLCELATADAGSAIGVAAAALGIDARPGVPPIERVASVLGDAEVVVLVDNCEHVLEPIAELLDHVIARCPRVAVVATSRERLRLPGEQVCAVPTLPVDEDDAAAQLFVERARAVVPNFEPDESERACVAEIVRRLDGLPLAIELAAARLHTHDVAEVAAGLDRRFSLLSSGHRTTPRHASLRAAVSWSFGLLDDHLQDVFVSVSVFAGPFTAADAAAMCDLDAPTVDAALAQLTERSLVMRSPGRGFMLLETLRAFGTEQLATSGRHEVVRERHARYFVHWIERADRRLAEPGRSTIAEIDAAIPELRVALGWLVDQGQIELAGRLVAALLDYGLLRLRPDVLAWSERVTGADPEDRSPVAALMWVSAAYAAWMGGDTIGTGDCSARALALSERGGGEIPSRVAVTRGSYALFVGHLDDAVRWYRRAVASAGDDRGQRVLAAASEVLALGYAGDASTAERAEAVLAEVAGATTAHAAYAWYCAGEADLAVDLPRVQVRLARALDLAEQTDASFVAGIAGASKASIDARIGDPARAAQEYRRLIGHWRRAGMWSTQWTMLRSIAALLARLGRDRAAAVLLGAVHATGAGHSVFGTDEVALHELDLRLRDTLGDEAYEAALAEGAALDGDAAVEHALRTL